jgi:hypothetical protein
MNKNLFNVSVYIFLIVFYTILFQSCDDSGVTAKQDFVAGTVTFTDTNLICTGGYYAVSVFPDSSAPFHCIPVGSDSLVITKSGYLTTAHYKVSGLSAGSYYIGTTWIRASDGCVRGVLGTYGCDTAHYNCTNTIVSLPNYEGSSDCNILSWTDTLKKLH